MPDFILISGFFLEKYDISFCFTFTLDMVDLEDDQVLSNIDKRE